MDTAVGGPLLLLDVPTIDGRLLLSGGMTLPAAPVPLFVPGSGTSLGYLDAWERRGDVVWGFGRAIVPGRLYVGADLSGQREWRGDLYVFTAWSVIGASSHGPEPPARLWEGHDTYVEPV